MKTWKFLLICFLLSCIILGVISILSVNSVKKDTQSFLRTRSAELVYTGVEYAYTSAVFKQSSNTNIIEDISLDEINAELNVDVISKHEVVGDVLQITTNDNAYCKVIKNDTNRVFEVTCGTSDDFTGNDLISLKTIKFVNH